MEEKLDLQTTYRAIVDAAREGRYVSYGELAKASGVEWGKARFPLNDQLGARAVGRFSSGRMIRGRGNFVLTTAVPDIGTGNRHPALQGGVNRSPAGSMAVPDRRHRTAIPVIRPPEALASA